MADRHDEEEPLLRRRSAGRACGPHAAFSLSEINLDLPSEHATSSSRIPLLSGASAASFTTPHFGGGIHHFKDHLAAPVSKLGQGLRWLRMRGASLKHNLHSGYARGHLDDSSARGHLDDSSGPIPPTIITAAQVCDHLSLTTFWCPPWRVTACRGALPCVCMSVCARACAYMHCV